MYYENEISEYAQDLIKRDFLSKELNKNISQYDVRYVQLLIDNLQKVIDLSSRTIISDTEIEELDSAIGYSQTNLTCAYSIKGYIKVLESVSNIMEKFDSYEEDEDEA